MKTNDKLIEQIGRAFPEQVFDARRAFDDFGKTDAAEASAKAA